MAGVIFLHGHDKISHPTCFSRALPHSYQDEESSLPGFEPGWVCDSLVPNRKRQKRHNVTLRARPEHTNPCVLEQPCWSPEAAMLWGSPN